MEQEPIFSSATRLHNAITEPLFAWAETLSTKLAQSEEKRKSLLQELQGDNQVESVVFTIWDKEGNAFQFNALTNVVTGQERQKQLAEKPGKLLYFMVKHPEHMQTIYRTIRFVWDQAIVDDDARANLRILVSNLRKTLDDISPTLRENIKTIAGRGHVYVGRVQEEHQID